MDNTSLVHQNTTRHFQSGSQQCPSEQNQVTTRTNIGNVQSKVESSYNSKYTLSFKVFIVLTKSHRCDCSFENLGKIPHRALYLRTKK